MSMPGAHLSGITGFFGKLPCAGDFVQRRLPGSFVEHWDACFERGVAESKTALGGAWLDAYRSSPKWRFVLAPRVCGENAWAGVMGPGTDRVGRNFPMVVASSLPPSPNVCGEALLRSAWFDEASRVLSEAQNDARRSIEAFDAEVAGLGSLATPATLDPRDLLDRTDWKAGTHWRLPLPAATVFSSKYLSVLWSRLGSGNWCLWWTEGGGRVPASVLVTAGLPQAQAYAGFLDATQAAAWQTVGVFAASQRLQASMTKPVEVQAAPAARPTLPPLPAPMAIDSDITQPAWSINPAANAPRPAPPAPSPPPAAVPLHRSSGDLSDLLPSSPQPAPARPQPAPSSSAQAAASRPQPAPFPLPPYIAVLRREDCAMTVVAADSSEHDPQQRGALEVFALVRLMRPAECTVGVQALRNRLLDLHARLRAPGGDLVNPAGSDCAIAAACLGGGQASVLRIGAASAWRWRRGHLQALFQMTSSSHSSEPPSLGDDLDDLLFSAPPPADTGLGSAGTPAWDESNCSVQPGDRLLIAASRRLIHLSPDVIARGLGMRTREEATARIAAAAGLPPDMRRWPFAVIEIGS